MIGFFKFPAYALIPLSGVRFLCRLGQVIAGWVSAVSVLLSVWAVWVFLSVSVFLSVLQKEHLVIKSFLCILKINAEKEINKEIVFFKVVYI